MAGEKIIKDQIDIPVTFVIRITRKETEARERALLVAKDERGREFTFSYLDCNEEHNDLTVNDLIKDR